LNRPEVVHRRSWTNREAAALAMLEWVDWFDNTRLLGPIGDIPPAEAEATCNRQSRELAVAA
jgi:putative transposase